MKLSQLALAAVLSSAWAVSPLTVRAHEHDEHDKEESDEGGMRMGGREGKGGRRDRGDNSPEMKGKFEKVRALEKKSRDLSRKMRKGSDAEKAAAKNEARKTVGELFDAKLAMETAMLEKLEKHAAELKEKIAKKKSSREKAIEARLDRMSGEDDDFE
jgi:hypothetical protein